MSSRKSFNLKFKCPIAVEVFEGNTGDPSTLAAQVKKLKERFRLSRVVLVGDRGMITDSLELTSVISKVRGLWLREPSAASSKLAIRAAPFAHAQLPLGGDRRSPSRYRIWG